MDFIVLWVFIAAQWVVLQFVEAGFPGHTHIFGGIRFPQLESQHQFSALPSTGINFGTNSVSCSNCDKHVIVIPWFVRLNVEIIHEV